MVIEIIAIYMQYQGQEIIHFKKSWIGTKLATCTKVFSCNPHFVCAFVLLYFKNRCQTHIIFKVSIFQFSQTWDLPRDYSSVGTDVYNSLRHLAHAKLGKLDKPNTSTEYFDT